MKHRLFLLTVILSVLTLFTACQQGISTFDDPDPTEDDKVAVRFQVMQVDQVPFGSTRATDIKDLCHAITLAVYSDGTKTEQVNQTDTDKDFGTLSLTLAPGTYRVIIIAHNGDKAPTMTNPEKITFADNKLTDTFYYTQELTITDATTQAVTLQRAVAMFRLAVSDSIPDNVATMKFYYTGGSSTFDGIHGVGIVNSRQTELRTVTADMRTVSAANAYSNGANPVTFDVYTFPRADSEALTMTVTALDASNSTITEKKFENVAIQRNMITLYTGAFFGSLTGSANANFTLYTNDEWTTQSHNY